MKLKNQWNKQYETSKVDVRKDKKDPEKMKNRTFLTEDGLKPSRKEIAFSKKVKSMKTNKPAVDKFGKVMYGTGKGYKEE